MRPLLAASLLGGAAGAGLLLILPAAAFETVVPALVLIAAVLVAVQPALSRRLHTGATAHRTGNGEAMGPRPRPSRPLVSAAGFLGVYGGYFGAGQGVILIAVLALGIEEDLQVVNALKNAAVTAANTAAALVFTAVADLDWTVVVLIAVGSILGGQIGARVGRRLPASALRALVVVLGCSSPSVSPCNESAQPRPSRSSEPYRHQRPRTIGRTLAAVMARQLGSRTEDRR